MDRFLSKRFGISRTRICSLEREAAWLARDPAAVIAGVDEAGRGPLAGPVTAAAVVLPHDLPPELRNGLDDSKALSARRRESLDALLRTTKGVRFAVGQADVTEIDRINILNATLQAMARAVAALGPDVTVALIDGNRAPPLPPRIEVETLIGGDGLSLSIAAASIVAKVARDRLMRELDERFPGYGWADNMGYGTKAHMAALARLGVTPHHRLSFAPVRNAALPKAGS